MNLFQKLVEKIPMVRKAVVSLTYEPVNVSNNATVRDVQQAIRSAEAGDTRQLFALYRDLTVSGSHVQTELNKRKLAVVAQPAAILPEDKNNDADLKAAEAIRTMIANCENWLEALIHVLDGTLWPVAVGEKIYRAATGEKTASGKPLQYLLKKIEPVNPTVLCFRQPYNYMARSTGANDAVTVDPDAWEPDLRFYKTDPDGTILWSYADAYPAERARHVVHRGHLLVGVRDNWGGPMRAIVFWWLLGVLGRDWFGRYMERFGQPFIVGKTESNDPNAVDFLKAALSLSTKVGGLVVDHETEIELKEAMSSNGADAYERFLGVCNREISKVILGQTLSAEAQPTGLGASTGQLQGEVREDYRAFDQIRLGETLRQQVFRPFLEINGFDGAPPNIVWGGLSPEEAAHMADLLVKLNQASLEPTDEALPTISERVGFQLQRKALPEPGMFGPGSGAGFTKLAALSAAIPRLTHPSDRIAAARAKALGDAYRGSMAPFRQIVLSSESPEECLKNLELFYPDWKPDRLQAELETALQLCAAAGAAAGVQHH